MLLGTSVSRFYSNGTYDDSATNWSPQQQCCEYLKKRRSVLHRYTISERKDMG